MAMSKKSGSAPSELARVKRFPERGLYDASSIYSIVDSALLSHVAYVIDGQPIVTPTVHWRRGNQLYWHGSSASRMLRTLAKEVPVSVAITHFDGLIFARTGFSHSANYRSVMAFGHAVALTEQDEKEQALEDFIDKLAPGRWSHLRPATTQEYKATHVLRMDLDNASAKVRTGHPNDDLEDLIQPVWAGTVPLKVTAGTPIPDPRGDTHPLPDNLSALSRYFAGHWETEE